VEAEVEILGVPDGGMSTWVNIPCGGAGVKRMDRLRRTADSVGREGELKGDLEGELEVESRPAWMYIHATGLKDIHSCLYPNPRVAFRSHGTTGGLMVALNLEQGGEQMDESLLFSLV